MSFGIKIEVWGDRACFTRPELSVERVSYDVITPSAARGILDSIYWHPGMIYKIDRIHVLNEIKFSNIRRNEVKSKALASSLRSAALETSGKPHIITREDIQQRASMILIDVRYMIEAHFEITDHATNEDNPGKFKDIIMRRLKRGQCYSMPYFGTREFPANFKLYEGSEEPEGFYRNREERNFGLMLYDMDFSDPNNITPIFYRAAMKEGIINVAGSEVFR